MSIIVVEQTASNLQIRMLAFLVFKPCAKYLYACLFYMFVLLVTFVSLQSSRVRSWRTSENTSLLRIRA